MSTAKLSCSVAGCEKKIAWRGLCNAHYHRWQRHGDPLGGRAPQDEARAFLENTVLPFSDKVNCLIWPYGRYSTGYARIRLAEHPTNSVHRIACIAANGEPPSPFHQAAHSCGNGKLGCVNPHHQSWKTRSENEADKIGHGTSNRGERNGQSRLTEDVARQILAMKHLPRREIANRLNIPRDTVRSVVSGRRWGWLAATAVAIVLLISMPPARAFAHQAPTGWSYPFSCCSGIDCREVPDADIIEGARGYEIRKTHELIPMTDPKVKMSPDGRFHLCTVGGLDDSRTICLFAPSRGF